MESPPKELIIDTEEELISSYISIYNKLKEDEYTIPQPEAAQMIKDLTLIESKAKEYGIISPNEEVEGKSLVSANP